MLKDKHNGQERGY